MPVFDSSHKIILPFKRVIKLDIATKLMFGTIATIFLKLQAKTVINNADVPLLHTTAYLDLVNLQILLSKSLQIFPFVMNCLFKVF